MRKEKLNIFFVLLSLCLLLVACSSPDETVDNGGNQTLLIYMCGSDLESRKGYASKNIGEMMSADLPSNVNVLIQTGGAKAWHNENISASNIGRYEIQNGQLKSIQTLPQSSMGDGDTLLSFLTFAKEHYATENVSLIFWDHGNGAEGSVCYDELYQYDALTLTEIDHALKQANMQFEFIGFDACLMATYDTAKVLDDYADYMIASQELEPASGWDYKALLEALEEKDFYSKVLNAYAARQDSKTYYTLSVVQLSELSIVDQIIGKIIDNINTDISMLGEALNYSTQFGANETSRNKTNLFDLSDFAQNLGIACDLDQFIKTANGSARQSAGGLSIYFPAEKIDNQNDYIEMCQNTLYADFLTSYINRIPENPIQFENRGYDDNGKLSFVLTEESLPYVQSVRYDVHIYADGATDTDDASLLYCVGADNDIMQRYALYTVDFSGRWIYLNDTLLHCDILDEQDGYTLFYAPVIIDKQYCYLIFSYAKSTKTASIEGYIEGGEIGSRINPLGDGTEIRVIYEIVNDGEDVEYYEEGVITYGSDTTISVKPLEKGYYQYIPKVVDIYGNAYYADTAIVSFDGTTVTVVDISAG